MKYSTIRGMDDILPDKSKAWQTLEEKARKSFSLYGYKEIRTPIVENTEVFVRGIGKDTDIVSKEMYTFNDRKGRSLSLRPEGTAPVVRSFVQHALERNTSENRLYYMGPMFRSERPQKGRLRQFHQIGAELIGPDSVYADAEIITQLNDMLHSFGLKEFKLYINSLGCTKDKEKYSEALRKYLKDKDFCQILNAEDPFILDLQINGPLDNLSFKGFEKIMEKFFSLVESDTVNDTDIIINKNKDTPSNKHNIESLSEKKYIGKAKIYLKSGKIIDEEIIEQTDELIKTSFHGAKLTYWFDDIEKIELKIKLQKTTHINT